jgi:hypothetical protein
MKCLFLRVRYPPAQAMEDLVKKIFLTNVHNDKTISLIKRCKLGFSDYRNKYNDAITNLADEYKKIRYFFVFILIK